MFNISFGIILDSKYSEYYEHSVEKALIAFYSCRRSFVSGWDLSPRWDGTDLPLGYEQYTKKNISIILFRISIQIKLDQKWNNKKKLGHIIVHRWKQRGVIWRHVKSRDIRGMAIIWGVLTLLENQKGRVEIDGLRIGRLDNKLSGITFVVVRRVT